MARYVALLRGVNVSGKNKLPMALLREAIEATPLYDVTTYIQSGNIVFNADLEIATCEQMIADLLKAEFDLNVPVIVREQAAIKDILKVNPFETRTIESSKFMSFGFFDKIPVTEKIDEVMSFSTEMETFKIVDDVMYFYCGVGFGKTKLTNAWFEKKLGVRSTMRNYNTTLKLTEL
ncbi:conserved hypothetical protein [Flavobacteria bacterium BBFL7]|nr:conserved hypothetical protein [Flavobacteria bacterium BBFL7]